MKKTKRRFPYFSFCIMLFMHLIGIGLSIAFCFELEKMTPGFPLKLLPFLLPIIAISYAAFDMYHRFKD